VKATNMTFDEIRQEIKIVSSHELKVATHYYCQGVKVVNGDFVDLLVMNGSAHHHMHDMWGAVKCVAREEQPPAQPRDNGPFSYPVGDN